MYSKGFVHSGRARLATQIVGEGLPVVFLHASICDHRMWQKQLDVVGAGNMAVSYDRRGYGETQCEAETHSPVADLMAVIRR